MNGFYKKKKLNKMTYLEGEYSNTHHQKHLAEIKNKRYRKTTNLQSLKHTCFTFAVLSGLYYSCGGNPAFRGKSFCSIQTTQVNTTQNLKLSVT